MYKKVKLDGDIVEVVGEIPNGVVVKSLKTQEEYIVPPHYLKNLTKNEELKISLKLL